MTFKPTFKICRNCGAEAGLKARLCCSPNGCGPSTRQERRAGRKSYWDLATSEQQTAKDAKQARIEAMINELAGEG